MKKVILAAAIAAVASMSIAAFASAGLFGSAASTGPAPTFQAGSGTLTATTTFNGQQYVHTYNTVTNPCNGTFVGTAAPGDIVPNEVVFGSTGLGLISIAGQYPTSYASDPGYSWTYVGTLSGVGVGHDSHGLKWTTKFVNTPSNPGVCA